MLRFPSAVLAGLAISTGAASAEQIIHTYDMYVGGLRVASAEIRGVVQGGGYALNAGMTARGIAGMITGGNFSASVTGLWDGEDDFAPQRFEQVSTFRGKERELVIEYAERTPVSATYTPARDADDDPIPPLAMQTGTVDFMTAMLTLTFPGTPEEICARRMTAFTFTKRTLLEGTGTVGGTPDALTCTVEYANVDPETYVEEERERYTMELRPLPDGRYEVARISGPSEFGRAIFQRTN